MRPRRTLPTIRHHRPLWWRLARELLRRIVVGWAQYRRRCAIEEERGHRAVGRINGYQIGKEYRHNRRAERRGYRETIANWNR